MVSKPWHVAGVNSRCKENWILCGYGTVISVLKFSFHSWERENCFPRLKRPQEKNFFSEQLSVALSGLLLLSHRSRATLMWLGSARERICMVDSCSLWCFNTDTSSAARILLMMTGTSPFRKWFKCGSKQSYLALCSASSLAAMTNQKLS